MANAETYYFRCWGRLEYTPEIEGGCLVVCIVVNSRPTKYFISKFASERSEDTTRLIA